MHPFLNIRNFVHPSVCKTLLRIRKYFQKTLEWCTFETWFSYLIILVGPNSTFSMNAVNWANKYMMKMCARVSLIVVSYAESFFLWKIPHVANQELYNGAKISGTLKYRFLWYSAILTNPLGFVDESSIVSKNNNVMTSQRHTLEFSWGMPSVLIYTCAS